MPLECCYEDIFGEVLEGLDEGYAGVGGGELIYADGACGCCDAKGGSLGWGGMEMEVEDCGGGGEGLDNLATSTLVLFQEIIQG